MVIYKNPVIFLMNGIGDAIIGFPTVRALAHKFRGEATLLTGKHRYADLFRSLPLKQTVQIQHHWLADAGRTFDVHEVLHSLSLPCDLFISLNPWHSPSSIALQKALKPTQSYGLTAGFDISVPFDTSIHNADLTFSVAKAFDDSFRLEHNSSPLTFPPEVRDVTQSFFSQLQPGAKLMAIHHDSSSEKRWDDDKFRSVVRRFLDDHPEYVCLVLGLEDLFDAEMSIPGRVIQRPAEDLLLRQCLLSRSSLFFGIDSSMLHIADLFRIPSVGLFNFPHASEFGFRFSRNITFQNEASLDFVSEEDAIMALEIIATSDRLETSIHNSPFRTWKTVKLHNGFLLNSAKGGAPISRNMGMVRRVIHKL